MTPTNSQEVRTEDLLRPLLRHVLQQLQRPHLDLVVGGLGGPIHQFARLERVPGTLPAAMPINLATRPFLPLKS
jgi:hypothetical protein